LAFNINTLHDLDQGNNFWWYSTFKNKKLYIQYIIKIYINIDLKYWFNNDINLMTLGGK
jgi:hypothetical protein